jgi:hypothetical protein
MDHDEQRDEELDSEDEDMEAEDAREEPYRVKTEITERSIPDAEDAPAAHDTSTPPIPVPNGSIKQTISSIIDSTPETERAALASLPPSESISQGPTLHPEQTVPAKRKYEYSPEKENTEPKEGSTAE